MFRIIFKAFLFFSLFVFTVVTAAPKEIIIVRHGDKLTQKNHGPTLDPTGYVRAVHLGFYILKTYGKPDYLVASNPDNSIANASSIRELQTIAPLANMLEQQNPNLNYPILHPYTVPDYPKLARYLLSDPKFNGKVIVVCWDHYTIPSLVKAFGITEKQPVWSGTDFDSVYVLKFAANGKIQSYQLLHNQYPVKAISSWENI